MKPKHSVPLFLIVGLVFAVAAMVNFPAGNACAGSSDGVNAVEQLLGNPPEILKNLCPDVLKALMDTATAGEMTGAAAPDAASPPPVGNKNVCVSISSAAFYAVPMGTVGCNQWFIGMLALAEPCSIMTGVNFPNGAEIYKLEMTAIDNNASKEQSLALFRLKKDLTIEQMAVLDTSGQSTDVRQFSTEAITTPTVVLPDYSYFIFSTLNLDIAFISARIWYHPHTNASFKSIAIEE